MLILFQKWSPFSKYLISCITSIYDCIEHFLFSAFSYTFAYSLKIFSNLQQFFQIFELLRRALAKHLLGFYHCFNFFKILSRNHHRSTVIHFALSHNLQSRKPVKANMAQGLGCIFISLAFAFMSRHFT